MRSYIKAYAGLYGNDAPTVIKRKPRKKRINREEPEQIILVAWLNKNGIFNWHTPNQRHTSMFQGAKLKRMGVLAGVPDITIPIARKSYHGLYIEFKPTGSTMCDVKPNQRRVMDRLTQEGYLAVPAFGLEHAKKIVLEYLA